MTDGFNDWWNGEVEQAHNPYQRSSAAYWAWLGWMAGAAHEREACARVCEKVNWYDRHEAAAAIRARGDT